MEWHGEHKIELHGHCSFPSVTATSEGVILLAYIKNKTIYTCYYVVGKLRVGNQVEWSHSVLIDDGKNISVSLHAEEGDILTVVLAFVSEVNCGYTRVGVQEPSRNAIKWKCEKRVISSVDNLKEVSTAICPSKDNIVAYRLTFTNLCCQVGKLTTTSDHAFDDQCIEFHSEETKLMLAAFILQSLLTSRVMSC